MDPEAVDVPCPDCKVTSESTGPGLAHWDCPGCRRSYFLRRCSACGLVSHVGALQGRGQPWDCVWCKEANSGFTPSGDPAAATVADLSADVASHGLAFPPGEPECDTQPFPIVTVIGNPAVPPSRLRGPAPAAPRSGRTARRIAVLAATAAAFVVVAGGLAAAADSGRPSLAGAAPAAPAGIGRTGQAGMNRTVSVTALDVGTVDLQGVPGQLTIVGTGASRVELTGQLQWTGHAPVVTTWLGHARVLHLSYRCATASPCTENYRLAVPRRTATILRQPSGHVVLSGLAGPLRITAGSVDISAVGLRSPTLTAAIVSGHLSASFDVPPRHVSIALTSAQATVRLPASVRYDVSSQVASGYVHISVPQGASGIRTVTDHINSGELELLPA
jgi:hypothetical protein